MAGHGLLIAAPQSGSGKTTVSLAIMSALKRRGLAVAPFKCGPDFIDPGYHRLVTGRPSINLDAWICPDEFVSGSFLKHSFDADLAVIEGVMGLFDGLGASPFEGSSARIAAITGAPVVLVVNARGMAASAAALVKGFAGFDPCVKVAGVIFNNVGSESHAELLRQVMSQSLPEVAVFGCIPRDECLEIPSRHLGLVTAEDNPLPPEFLERLAELAERYLDLDGLAGLKTNPPHPPICKEGRNSLSLPAIEGRVRIAVASDAAFCFVYEDNLRLLREAGAEIVTFSPLEDGGLPDGIGGIYLPGGYPELYADRLAANSSMLAAIRNSVAADMPVYAECGGYVYLTEGLEETADRAAVEFVGIFPVRARMLPRRKALGYRQAELLHDTLLGVGGGVCRGHEFHYSETGVMPDGIGRNYNVSRQDVLLGREGFGIRNCLGSYLHLHFGSNPGIAPALVAACRQCACKTETPL
ncbi:MAG: cobyrinate a,c-diamide synthase [Deltaproteobacteria bacterium]|nr:cobyrinate a,c-diamide synthase [Deltaproteobacteria bacterium]